MERELLLEPEARLPPNWRMGELALLLELLRWGTVALLCGVVVLRWGVVI